MTINNALKLVEASVEVTDIVTDPDSTQSFQINGIYDYVDGGSCCGCDYGNFVGLDQCGKHQVMLDVFQKTRLMGFNHQYFHLDENDSNVCIIANDNPDGAIGGLDECLVQLYEVFRRAEKIIYDDEYY